MCWCEAYPLRTSVRVPSPHGAPVHHATKKRPFIPVEFSVAAFRFAHSMVRPRYTISESVGKMHLFSDDPAVSADNKRNGSRAIPPRLNIQWSGAALALEAAAKLPGKIGKAVLFEPPFIVDDSRPPAPADYVARVSELVAAGRRGDAVELFMSEMVGVPSVFLAAMRNDPSWAVQINSYSFNRRRRSCQSAIATSSSA